MRDLNLFLAISDSNQPVDLTPILGFIGMETASSASAGLHLMLRNIDSECISSRARIYRAIF